MLVKITVNRKPSTAEWTLSSFSSNDNSISGVGVEDEFRALKVHGETRIGAGIYNLGLHYPSNFSKEYYRDDFGNLILAKERTTQEQKIKFHTAHEMIMVMGVKNFKFILWHWGNTDLDTEGCYVVGTSFGKLKTKKGDIRDGVISSRAKYLQIYPIIWRAIKEQEKIKKFVTVEYKNEQKLA